MHARPPGHPPHRLGARLRQPADGPVERDLSRAAARLPDRHAWACRWWRWAPSTASPKPRRASPSWRRAGCRTAAAAASPGSCSAMAWRRCPSPCSRWRRRAWPVLGARFLDRIGKGIRGAPRDAMIADETPPELRGRAFGLRQSLDTVGAMVAPLAAIALMAALPATCARSSGSPPIPAFLCFLLAWLALKEPARHSEPAAAAPFFAGFRDIDPANAPADHARLPVHARALLRRLPGPESDRGRPVGGLVAAGAGDLQPRLRGARLPGRGAGATAPARARC